MTFKNEAGFTFIKAIILVAVFIVLLAIAIPNFIAHQEELARKNGKPAKTLEMVNDLRSKFSEMRKKLTNNNTEKNTKKEHLKDEDVQAILNEIYRELNEDI